MKKINVALVLAVSLALSACNDPTNPGPSSGNDPAEVGILVSCEDGSLVTRDADTYDILDIRPLEVGEVCP